MDDIRNVIVAYADEMAIGCGAFKKYSKDTVEIKRMFVKDDYQGKGFGKKILVALETWAKEDGYKKCILETGNMLLPAIRLYENSGYQRIPNYDQYKNAQTSVCMLKTF